MTLPGWVGFREPRGRLGGRYTKNVTICPTSACTTPLAFSPDVQGWNPSPPESPTPSGGPSPPTPLVTDTRVETHRASLNYTDLSSRSPRAQHRWVHNRGPTVILRLPCGRSEVGARLQPLPTLFKDFTVHSSSTLAAWLGTDWIRAPRVWHRLIRLGATFPVVERTPWALSSAAIACRQVLRMRCG